MIAIGKLAGKPVSCVLTSMEQPLGDRVGNILEMQEVFDALSGKALADVEEVVLAMASEMLRHTDVGKDKSSDELIDMCREKLNNGEALAKFQELILSQGGQLDSSVLRSLWMNLLKS
jgi:thymidine phosphorylase